MNILTIENIKKVILDEIKHTYLAEKLEETNISQTKLAILIELLNETDLDEQTQLEYIKVVMLIDIALATHEEVDNNEPDTVKEETKQQLTVLAGDFYSGLYYYLLANLGNVELIRVLAKAINLINEDKMTLYSNQSLAEEELLELVMRIEARLLTTVAIYYKQSHKIEKIENTLLVDRLSKELNELNSSRPTSLVRSIKEIDKSLSNDQVKEKLVVNRNKVLQLNNN